jgi:putative CocE/NonD family hydrolase
MKKSIIFSSILALGFLSFLTANIKWQFDGRIPMRNGVKPSAELRLTQAEGKYMAADLQTTPGGRIIVQKNVMIPMRDGVRLATDIYRPEGEGRYPVVLVRTPYGNETPETGGQAKYYVEQGYAFAIQDCRGKYDSEGDWYGKRNEAEDGSDTITWLGTRPWSSGKVGMTGGSYLGMVQYLVADQENPYLKALVPMVGPVTLGRDASDFDHLSVYAGREGATANLDWMVMTDGRVNQSDLSDTLVAARNHLPIIDYPKILGREMKWWPFLLNNRYGFWEEYYLRASLGEWSKPIPDEAWWGSYEERYRKVRVPMLHISGWFDCCGEPPIKNFQLIRKYAAEPLARENQHLMMGPWIHGVGKSKNGDLEFGPLALLDPDSTSVRWFDHWLKGEDNGVEKERSVRVFVMGENRWREADDWPIPGTKFTNFYLHSRGEARLNHGGGGLSTEPPAAEPADRYTYDPGDPTPGFVTDTEALLGAVDMARVEKRDDVLVYNSEVLNETVEVTGPLSAILYVATSAPSTDLIVRLIDVYPDGRPYNIFLTYANQYRTHWAKEVEKAPDGTRIIKADIWLPPTSVAFRVGHRIRVEVCSASAPRARGLNVEPGTEVNATRWNVAKQTIYHDKAHPSHIVLPVIPR